MLWVCGGRRVRLAALQIQRLRPHDAEQDRRPVRLAGPPGCRPRDIQRLDCGPRHNRFRPNDVGLGQKASAKIRASQVQERLQFSKRPVVLEPQSATPRAAEEHDELTPLHSVDPHRSLRKAPGRMSGSQSSSHDGMLHRDALTLAARLVPGRLLKGRGTS